MMLFMCVSSWFRGNGVCKYSESRSLLCCNNRWSTA